MTLDYCKTSYRLEYWLFWASGQVSMSEMVHIESSNLITMRLSIGDQSKSMQNKSKSEYRMLCKWSEAALTLFECRKRSVKCQH